MIKEETKLFMDNEIIYTKKIKRIFKLSNL